jgi:hypothetical protein
VPPSYELKTTDLGHFYDLWEKGHVSFYKCQRTWSDSEKAAFIAGVLRGYPMEVVLVNVQPALDKDGTHIQTYVIVNGRQRMASLFEYRDDREDWIGKAVKRGFIRYGHLSEAERERFDSCRLLLISLWDYTDHDLRKIYRCLSEQTPIRHSDRIMIEAALRKHAGDT